VPSRSESRAEIAGLVHRAGAGDGSRAVIVSLTPAGHAVVERLVDHVLRREAELISSLAAEPG
jgi:DNA-binding MarR family transcriptional regulator